MKQHQFKVSVLLVSCNQEKYIAQCVESILMQKADFNVEVVIADDFSSDFTLSIVLKLMEKGPFPFEVLSSDKRLGMVDNYKRGFNACKGEFIAVLEGDDYWTDPDRLRKLVGIMDENKKCVMCFNRFDRLYENTSEISHSKWAFKEDYEYLTTQKLALGNRIGNLSACVFKRSAILTMNPELYSIKFADWLLAMELGQVGEIIQYKEVMSVYRVHDKGAWSRLSRKKRIDNILKLTDKYNKYFHYKYNPEFKRLRRYYLFVKHGLPKKYANYIAALIYYLTIKFSFRKNSR